MGKLEFNLTSSFSRSILTLFAGNVIAFILPVALYPVLSRIFTPEDYALFGLYFSIFSFLEIASAGRYDFGVVMPEKGEDAINLAAGGLLISMLYSILVLVLVILLKDALALSLKNPQLSNWLFLLPFGLLLVSVSKICNGWIIRTKNFKAASINKASQKFAEVSAQLTLGLLKTGNGLIIGDFVGRVFNAVFSLYQSLHNGLDRSKVSKASIKSNLRRYSELPKYGVLPAMLNSLGGLLPVFIISSYYSVGVTGSFNFSRMVLSVPFVLIATGISQVVMQQVSERRHRNQPIFRELFSLALKLFGLSILAVIALYLAGPILFELIFGARWRAAGEYTSVMIFSTAVAFVVTPFSTTLVVLGQIRQLSLWQTGYFFAISILWFLTDITIQNFLVALVIIEGLSYAIYGLVIYKAVRKYEDSITDQA